MPELIDNENKPTPTPCVFVISDSRGETAAAVVEAAADQFKEGTVVIKQLGCVSSVDMVLEYLDKNMKDGVPVAVFHTIVNEHLRRELRREFDDREIPAIDLLGPAISVLSTLSHEEPLRVAGHRAHTVVEKLSL
jgi:hypothetical protein